MYFVVGFGFVALAWAAVYAAQGKRKPLAFAISMMAATLFSIGSGICSDLGTVFHFLSSVKDADTTPTQLTRIMMEGFGESLAPGIMGFSLLALTALLLAVGAARIHGAEGDSPARS
jgi:hypothetical protein